MTVDAAWLFAGLCVFVRAGAVLMSAPPFGTTVPVQIRILFAVVLGLAVTPVVFPHIGPVPQDLAGLLLAVGREVLVGLVIGGFVQILAAAFQSAGAFLDAQVGTATAQIFNPTLGGVASPLGQFKFMLGLVLLVVTDGHHMILKAFVGSYSLPWDGLAHAPGHALTLATKMGLLALQIAAPVAAVTLVIDLAAGVVNKAVPQSQPFLLALPAKLAIGMLVLALALPTTAAAVHAGLDTTFEHLRLALSGG